jgi:hypothetical protein
VLRVLANLLGLPGIDYNSAEEIRDVLRVLCGARTEAAHVPAGAIPNGEIPKGAWVDIPPYQVDVLVRGSEPLQKTMDGRLTRAVI